MEVRIYRPAKTATQSGRAKTAHWVLEHSPRGQRAVDDLMGWTGSDDTTQQVRLSFESREQAVAYARRKRLRLRGGGAADAHDPAQVLRRQLHPQDLRRRAPPVLQPARRAASFSRTSVTTCGGA